MKNKAYLSIGLIFLSTFLFMGAFLGNQNLVGPPDDGKFYLKMASIQSEEGLVKNYPWLYFTDYRENSSGLHFLFPLLLIPFLVIFPSGLAYIVSSAFFTAVLACLIWIVLKKMKVGFKWLWLILALLGSQDFIFRHALGRPITTSLIAILGIIYSIKYKLWWLCFILAFLNVWLYDGYFISLILALLYGVIISIVQKKLYWKEIVSVLAGFVIGNIINPFFPNNIKYLHTIITVPFLNKHIQDSNEWMSSNFAHLTVSSMIPIAFFLAPLVYLLVVAIRSKGISKINSDSAGFGVMASVLFLLTLLHRRFIEYFPPFAILFFVATFKEFISQITYSKITKTFKSIWQFKVAAFIVFFIFGFILYQTINLAAKDLKDNDAKTDQYKQAASFLKSQSTPNSIVFNVQWDQFAHLFYWDSSHFYINGLDPGFSHSFNPQLYDQWKKLYDDDVINQTPVEIIDILHNFDAKYLFIESDRSPNLFSKIEEAKLAGIIEEIYNNGNMSIYQLK